MARKQPPAPTLAQRVKSMRETKGLSLRAACDLAAKRGHKVPLGTWSEIESGANDNPKLAAVIGIASALGCPPSELLSAPAHAVRDIPTAAIFPNPANVRRTIDPDELAPLADSLREYGLLQPITVRPFQAPEVNGEAFEIVFGERRWRATVMAFGKNGTIKAYVRDISDDEQAMLMLAENMHRVEMAPLDVADALARNSAKKSTAELATATGKSRRWVQEMVSVGKHLCPDAREYLEQGHLKLSNAVLLASVRDKGLQATLAVEACKLTEEQLRTRLVDLKKAEDAKNPLLKLGDDANPPKPAPPASDERTDAPPAAHDPAPNRAQPAAPSPKDDSVPSSSPPPAATPSTLAKPQPAAVPTNGPLQVKTPASAASLPPARPIPRSLDWDKTDALREGSFHTVVFGPPGGPVKSVFASPSWQLLCAQVEHHYPNSDFLFWPDGWERDALDLPVLFRGPGLIVMRTDENGQDL